MTHIGLASGATAVSSSGASGGSGVRLANSGHGVYFNASGYSELPEGRYIGFVRVRATSGDYVIFKHRIWNPAQAPSGYLNEENAWVFETVRTGDGWVYKGLVFDVDSDDANDDVRHEVWMSGAFRVTGKQGALDVDYFLHVPICRPSGDWPQDVSHNALRTFTLTPDIYEK